MGAILTPTEAAHHLGRSRDFVIDRIADGTLDAAKINGRWYVHESSLAALSAPMPKVELEPDFPRVVVVRGRRVA